MGVKSMVNVQSVSFGNEGVEIVYMEESDFHKESGIAQMRSLFVPHECIPNDMLTEVRDAVTQIVDEAKTLQRQPTTQFQGRR